MIDLKIMKLDPRAILPRQMSADAACFDLYAFIPHPPDGSTEIRDCGVELRHGVPWTFRTGLAFEIPRGYAMMIYSRSGHGFKNDTRLANCVGVIDADYRGEVQVRLTRDASDTERLCVKHGDRIAQAMLIPVPAVQFMEVGELSETERGAGGFGSTGK